MSQGERSFVIIRENDFADIGVALGDSVTEFRVTDSVGQVSWQKQMEWSIQLIWRLCSKSQSFPRIKSCVMGATATSRTDVSISTHQEVIEFNRTGSDLSSNWANLQERVRGNLSNALCRGLSSGNEATLSTRVYQRVNWLAIQHNSEVRRLLRLCSWTTFRSIWKISRTSRSDLGTWFIRSGGCQGSSREEKVLERLSPLLLFLSNAFRALSCHMFQLATIEASAFLAK